MYLHPAYDLVMCELEYELINNTINADSPADQLEFSICRVVEDEIVLVKV